MDPTTLRAIVRQAVSIVIDEHETGRLLDESRRSGVASHLKLKGRDLTTGLPSEAVIPTMFLRQPPDWFVPPSDEG